jgi:hypothetical protein
MQLSVKFNFAAVNCGSSLKPLGRHQLRQIVPKTPSLLEICLCQMMKKSYVIAASVLSAIIYHRLLATLVDVLFIDDP